MLFNELELGFQYMTRAFSHSFFIVFQCIKKSTRHTSFFIRRQSYKQFGFRSFSNQRFPRMHIKLQLQITSLSRCSDVQFFFCLIRYGLMDRKMLELIVFPVQFGVLMFVFRFSVVLFFFVYCWFFFPS